MTPIDNPTPSQTALLSAAARAAHPLVDAEPLLHVDPLAATLLGPGGDEMISYHRLQGDHPILAGARLTVTCRARFTEERVLAAARAGVRQHVVLAAGLDSFAYRLPADVELQVWEVDQPATQRWKRDRLAGTGIAEPAAVHFVPADLDDGHLATLLADHGLDPSLPAAVSWLGCTMYLEPAAVARTLAELGRLAPGTEVMLDYLVPPALQDEAARSYSAQVAAASGQLGEPWRGTFTPEDMAAMLASAGLTAVTDVGQHDAVEPHLWTRSDVLHPTTLQRLVHARVPAASSPAPLVR